MISKALLDPFTEQYQHLHYGDQFQQAESALVVGGPYVFVGKKEQTI